MCNYIEEKFEVVIVDDEPWILTGIEKTFNFDKYNMTVALKTTDPNAALEFIITKSPDVVFTDIRMPKMDGIELIRQTHIQGGEPLFVVLSGYSDYELMKQAIRNGVFDYCLKPFDDEEVSDMMERVYESLVVENTANAEMDFETREAECSDAFNELLAYINEHYNENIRLKDLAERYYFNANYLCLLFKKKCNATFSKYLLDVRMKAADKLILETNIKIESIAYSVGFNSCSYFNKCYTSYFGISPTGRRREGSNKRWTNED